MDTAKKNLVRQMNCSQMNGEINMVLDMGVTWGKVTLISKGRVPQKCGFCVSFSFFFSQAQNQND